MRIAPLPLLVLLSLAACHSATDNPIVAAAARGDTIELGRLITTPAQANQCDHHGVTPIIAATRGGETEAIRLLAARGADPNLRDGRSTQWNPLMHAIHKNQMAAMVALLDAGADVNDRAAGGANALIMAAGYGNTNAVEVLLRHRADPSIADSNGWTALGAAVTGVPDIDCFTLGACQSETVRAILRHHPNAPLGSPARSARWIPRLSGCSDVLRLIDSPHPSRRGDTATRGRGELAAQ